MKKENRKMAQERRAAEREKLEKQKKMKKLAMIGIPVLTVLILIIVLVVDSVSSGSSTESDSTETSSSLQTDASLTVEDGDTVNIDYVGSIDGVEFEGGSTDGAGTALKIGSGSYIDDFEEQLIGAHPGDQVEVNVTFPDDYSQADLQGKDAVFDVTVNGIYEY